MCSLKYMYVKIYIYIYNLLQNKESNSVNCNNFIIAIFF